MVREPFELSELPTILVNHKADKKRSTCLKFHVGLKINKSSSLLCLFKKLLKVVGSYDIHLGLSDVMRTFKLAGQTEIQEICLPESRSNRNHVGI